MTILKWGNLTSTLRGVLDRSTANAVHRAEVRVEHRTMRIIRNEQSRRES
jgi:hypothetical protein